jgi:DNA-binding MarR family transcriptional regulator
MDGLPSMSTPRRPAPISSPARPPEEEADGDASRILDDFRRIVRGLRVSSRAAERDLGISGAQLFVLQKLGDGSVLSVSELARRTLTDQSSVSVVAARLVARGLILRTVSPLDARRVALRLSAKGRAVLAKAPSTPQERLVAAVAEMTPGQRKKLAGLLGTVVARAGLAEESSEMFFEDEGEGK